MPRPISIRQATASRPRSRWGRMGTCGSRGKPPLAESRRREPSHCSTCPGDFNTIAGLTSGPGGNLWSTEQEDGKTAGEQPAVGEITPAGVTKLYALQEKTINPNLGMPADPRVITTGPDGALWFGENGAIGRITTAGAIQQFPLPTPTATVEDITPGPDGAVWFAQQNPDFSYPILAGSRPAVRSPSTRSRWWTVSGA